MTRAELLSLVESDAAQYAAHTFDFTFDTAAILSRLSIRARAFFAFAQENKAPPLQVPEIYLPRWVEDPPLVEQFERLTEDERLEVLCLYTAPIHEFRHHADMVLTPFGARFHIQLAAEYLAFQVLSPFLLQNQEMMPPGPLKALETQMQALGQSVPAEWQPIFSNFKRQVLSFEACTDFRGMIPMGSATVRDPRAVMRVLDFEMEQVTVNGLAVTFSPKSKPNWYLRASTLLEGRAVIASLSWILWTLEGYENLASSASAYIETLYPPDENDDYRFLLDVAARWMGAATIEEGLAQQDPALVRRILFMVDSAAWFALHAPTKEAQGQRVNENLFRRFFFALQEMEQVYDRGYAGSPLKLLSTLETSERAQKFSVMPLTQGVESTLDALRQARGEVLPRLWQQEMRDHFLYVFDQLTTALEIRLEQGYVAPLAAAHEGNLLLYVDSKHRFLLEPYHPKRWVGEWFRFRNQSIFRPDSAASKRRHLAAQFGLAELAIPCACGVLLSTLVPKWGAQHAVTCEHCGRRHGLEAGNIRWIATGPEPEA